MQAALISIAGVVAAAAISNYVARKTAREQLRVQTDREFSVLLFKKRLENYCEIYRLLSDFIKLMGVGRVSEDCVLERDVSKIDIIKFLKEIEKWDSKNSILLTPHTSSISYGLRKDFFELIGKSDEEIKAEFSRQETREIWRRKVAGLEASIKNEIGVNAIKPFPTNTDFKPVFTYAELKNK